MMSSEDPQNNFDIENVDINDLYETESGNLNNNDQINEIEESNLSELIVLDPDHPLMSRFQNALKKLLSKQLETIELEDKETEEDLKKRKEEHLNLGNDLYGVQQELAKFQSDLENIQDEYHSNIQIHKEMDQQLFHVRNEFQSKYTKVTEENKKLEQLRKEMDNTALRLFYLKLAKKDIRGNIAVMRRAAEKAVENLYKEEDGKLKQDLLVDRLVEQVDRLKEEIGLYEAQIMAQSEERKLVIENLRDAQTEIQEIKHEEKKLMSQWNSTLIGLQRRNEAYCTMTEAVKEKRDQILSLQSELESHQKSMAKEQEKNEQLSLLLNKKQGDLATIKKQLALTQNKFMALKMEYSTYTRTLQEIESNLFRTNTDKNIRQIELDDLRKDIEKEFKIRVELEEKIVEELRNKLTMKKAKEYVNKLTLQMRDKTRHLETEVVILENKLSVDSLEVAKVKSRTKELTKLLSAMENEIQEKNETINKLELEISRNNINVERKQGTIDNLNKKLEQMITSAGGVELGPLEININHLHKNIQAQEDEINELEQQWLRQQQDLVRLFNQKNDVINNVSLLKQKLTILSQKQIRIEGDIEKERREKSEIERHLRHLQNDMIKLNRLIFQEKDYQETLEKENILAETDFIRSLKSEELESIQLKSKLMDIRNEKEGLLNELVEAERQIMLWEKKIQLTQETREAVDSEIGEGEMKIMKCEIHRMEVRYQQLLRQQELLIQDMEKSVSRREVIATRGAALQKVKVKITTKGGIEREIIELKRKIKQTLKNSKEHEENIQVLKLEKDNICEEIESRKQANDELQHQLDNVTLQLDELSTDRISKIIFLQQKQQIAKYYQQFKDKKYVKLFKIPTSGIKENESLDQKIASLNTIIDRLCREYPQVIRDLAPIRNMVLKKFDTDHY